MQALSPARLPAARYSEALSLEELEPVRPLRICLLGYRSHPYGGGQGAYLRYLSKALIELGRSDTFARRDDVRRFFASKDSTTNGP